MNKKVHGWIKKLLLYDFNVFLSQEKSYLKSNNIPEIELLIRDNVCLFNIL